MRHLVTLAVAATLALSGLVQAQDVRDVPRSRAEIQLSFAPVVQEVVPSVVNVYATSISMRSASPFASDPFFQRFFGLDSQMFGSRPQRSQSLGSGVIVDASGVILTNSHVVSGATDIRVSTSDNRQYEVDLVLDDPQSDLAVLRIRGQEGRSFPAIEFADSDTVAVGDLVLAIGNPFGVGQTVTSGIVSAVARTNIEAGDAQFFIQTDAAINPGNSGGALVDMAGRLVGINTAIFSRGGGSIGIGFAIPANLARLVATAGLSGAPLERAWLGARLQPMNPDLAASLGIDPPVGALVTEVASVGPAAEAGLQSGDVIVAVDDFPVTDPQEFTYRYVTRPMGSTSQLQIVRRGAAQSVPISVVSAAGYRGAEAIVEGNTRFAGATGAVLTAAFADELGLPYDARGIVIADVVAGSPAEQLGLRRGDLLLSLQGRDIVSLDDFRQATQGRPRAWQIILQRNGRVLRSMVDG